MKHFYKNIEYIPDEHGTATKVKCPLVDDFIEDVDCMENQEVSEKFIPEKFKKKGDWQNICMQCPFRDY